MDEEIEKINKRNMDLAQKLKAVMPDVIEPVEEEIQYKPLNVGEIQGKLISKRIAVGTKSEGWGYYIIPNDNFSVKWAEVMLRKKTMMWQDDPQLHPFVDKMVKIKGDIIETRTSITVDCLEIEEL